MFEAFAVYLSLTLIFRILSAFEKSLITKNETYSTVIEKKSLHFFRLFRHVFLIIISLETYFHQSLLSPFWQSLFMGVILFFVGISLRIASIKTLGKYWSYNIEIYEDHKEVTTGIFYYIKHPAYIGNIYLLGVCLMLQAKFTLIVTIVFVVAFYKFRAKIENTILKCLPKT